MSLGPALILIALVGDAVFFRMFGQSDQRQHFTEIDVERINVKEADGTAKLVIANRERAPDQVMDGQSRPRADTCSLISIAAIRSWDSPPRGPRASSGVRFLRAISCWHARKA